MFRNHSSAKRVSSFLPRLEILEHRTMPSELGDLLTSFGNTALINLTNAGLSTVSENLDIAAFNSNPIPNNFISVVVDTVKLSQSTTALADQVLTFYKGVQIADALGQLTPTESSALHARVTAASFRLSGLESAVNDALSDIFAPISSLLRTANRV